MTEKPPPFTIESFYNFVKQRKLMGAKCRKCGKLIVPPKPMCPECFSKDLAWKELRKEGKLITFTVIHISTEAFRSITPYAVGIVELEEGARLPGILRDVDLNEIKVGIKLGVDFQKELADEWPFWPRYIFKPKE